MKQRKDSAYTNGVIAVKEKKLLKEKLVKMCSLSEEEAFRILSDGGFGGGEATSDVERLILADENEIDAFIREYAPSEEAEEYLLAPRDFHNAKALVKARYLGCDPAPMLGGDGGLPPTRSRAGSTRASPISSGRSSAERSKRRRSSLRRRIPRERRSGSSSTERSFPILRAC